MLFLCLLAGIAFASCKKSSAPAPDTTLTQINGTVLLFDEGNKMVDKSDMIITIDGSIPLVMTTTDAQGNFVLPVPRSLKTFSVSYSKPGYGTFKDYWQRRTGDTLYYNYIGLPGWTAGNGIAHSLGAKSTVTVNSFSTVIQNDSLIFHCNISSPNIAGEKAIRIIYQKDNTNLSINTVDKTKLYWWYVRGVQNGDNTIVLKLNSAERCPLWITGDKIYFTAYGDSYYSNMFVDILGDNSLQLPNLYAVHDLPPSPITIP